MPLTPIAELAECAETAEEPLKSVFAELDRLVKAANGLWNAEAERFLLAQEGLRFTD